MSLSLVISAFLSMARSVPFFRGRFEWTGTGIVILPSSVSFWYILWLPVWRASTNPSFSSTLQMSLPEREGILSIQYKLEFFFFKFSRERWDIFYPNDLNIALGCILKHLKGFFHSIALCGNIKFRAIDYIPTLFCRHQFCSYLNPSHINSITYFERRESSISPINHKWATHIYGREFKCLR